MDNVWVSSQSKQPECERLGFATHRALADTAFLVQLTQNNRIAFLPFALNERDAWAVLFVAAGISERHGQYADSGDHQRFEILTGVVTSLIAADSWSRAHHLPVLTCPADERVRDLFESRGLADCLFIPVDEFLGRLEEFFLGCVGERRCATLRVFPRRPRSSVRAAEDQPALGARSMEAIGLPALSTGLGPERLPRRAAGPPSDDEALASTLFSVEEPRRQLRLRLAESHDRIDDLGRRLEWLEAELRGVHQSRAWRLATSLLKVKRRLIPANTRRARLFSYFAAFVLISAEHGLRTALARGSSKVLRRVLPSRCAPECPPAASFDDLRLMTPPAGPPSHLVHHREPIDVVVWIDRSYAEARAFLENVVRRTRPPYRLILVHDGKDAATLRPLEDFAASQGALLVIDPAATSPAAVIDLASAKTTAEFLAFVRCTTEVTRDWLDRLAACLRGDPRVGVAVPLSNRFLDGSPAGRDVEDDHAGWTDVETPDAHEIAVRIAADSGRLHAPLPRIDDDCLLLRRSALADGFKPSGLAATGRPAKAVSASRQPSGSEEWIAVLADDAYVHADRAPATSRPRSTAMPARNGQLTGAPRMESDRVVEGIRARTRHLHVRHAMQVDGRQRWEGKRLLLLMPVVAPGGVANVNFQEAAAMQAMGVDVRVLNVEGYRGAFEASYPDLEIPTVYAASPSDLSSIARAYDAVIATSFPTVEWMRPLRELDRPPRLGYYVQDYEPHLVMHDPKQFWEAWSSYLAFPELIRFTKTAWTRDEVRRRAGVDCELVGPSVNVDLFRPRPRRLSGRPKVVRIAAMVRPDVPCRQPRLTMEVLRAVQRSYGDRVDIAIFGGRHEELGDLPRDFPFHNAGVLHPRQVAILLNEVDLFVDFSSHQAMGLTAMEAMCCGAAVIAPTSGGAETFLRHEENGFLVDTSLAEDCIDAAESLVRETALRQSLGASALREIGRFFPERAAYRVLETLFPYPAEAR